MSAAMERHGRKVTVPAGRSLVELGEPTSDVYIVEAGSLRVTQISQNGREVIFRDVRPGSLCGEFSAFDGRPRSASVFALEQSKVWAIPSDKFRAVVHEDRAHVDWVLKNLTAQLRDLTEKVFELSVLNARNRLYCEILRLAEFGTRSDRSIVVQPAPTHGELAARIGTYRETVSREISYLTNQAMLELRRKKLIIHDLPGIAKELTDQLASDEDVLSGEFLHG
eukprot:s1_g2083.t1